MVFNGEYQLNGSAWTMVFLSLENRERDFPQFTIKIHRRAGEQLCWLFSAVMKFLVLLFLNIQQQHRILKLVKLVLLKLLKRGHLHQIVSVF